MHKYPWQIILCGIATLILLGNVSGCNKNRPDGFPNLVDYTMLIEKNGTPLSGASVNLIPETLGQQWTAGGETKSDGVVIFYTHMNAYMEKGVPEGKYKVTISKIPEVAERLSKAEMDKLSQEEFKEYLTKLQKAIDAAPKEVPQQLSNRSKTPLTVSIDQDNKTLTVKLEDFQ